jgi:hypothetical protein
MRDRGGVRRRHPVRVGKLHLRFDVVSRRLLLEWDLHGEPIPDVRRRRQHLQVLRSDDIDRLRTRRGLPLWERR